MIYFSACSSCAAVWSRCVTLPRGLWAEVGAGACEPVYIACGILGDVSDVRDCVSKVKRAELHRGIHTVCFVAQSAPVTNLLHFLLTECSSLVMVNVRLSIYTVWYVFIDAQYKLFKEHSANYWICNFVSSSYSKLQATLWFIRCLVNDHWGQSHIVKKCHTGTVTDATADETMLEWWLKMSIHYSTCKFYYFS